MPNRLEKEKSISIELDEKTSEGVFSNLAVLNHSSSEFVVDFIQMLPGMPKAKVKSRIILSPEHAKKFMIALNDNVSKYEKNFGEISLYHQENTAESLNFGNILGEA